MITSSKKTSHQYLRKIMVLPVIALVSLLFAFKINNYSENVQVSAFRPTGAGMIGQKTDVSVAHIYHSDTTKPTGKKQKSKEEQFNVIIKNKRVELKGSRKKLRRRNWKAKKPGKKLRRRD